MLHMLAMIGKGLGIVLLCLVLLVLLFLLAALFVPIRYRLFGEMDNGLKARARVSWLFHGVTVIVLYEEGMNLRLKIFGIPVYDKKRQEKRAAEKEKARRKKKRQGAAKREVLAERAPDRTRGREQVDEQAPIRQAAEGKSGTAGKETAEGARTGASGSETAEDARTGTSGSETAEGAKTGTSGKETAGAEPKTPVDKEGRRKKGFRSSLWKRICNFFLRLWEKIKNIRYRLQAFCDKIRGIRENIEYYRALWESAECRQAFSRCKKQLYRVYKNIRPKVIKAHIRIGFEDPSTTGQVLAVHGMLYPLLGNQVWLEPDFERQVLEGKALIKGRVTLFVLAKAALILYFDKNIRRVYQLLKKEEIKDVGQ